MAAKQKKRAGSSRAGISLERGKPGPFGAVPYEGGVNVALYARHATKVWLAVFDKPDAYVPVFEHPLDPKEHRFGDVWCAFVRGMTTGHFYCYRVDGPKKGKQGHNFEPDRYLVDPYAKVVAGNTAGGLPKGGVVHLPAELPSVTRRARPLTESIIYEVHIRGFTIAAEGLQAPPGTYEAFAEKIPYLEELGITAVELMPVHECGERTLVFKHPETGEPLANYWGYSTLNFFAPDSRFGSKGGQGEQVDECRDMISALHDAGIEVILDVVYNHTSEGNEKGSVQSLRGIDSAVYFIISPEGKHTNYTGCGNTVNCNHPITSELIIDSMRYWVCEMGVDGFRFDLAPILNRDKTGALHQNAPIVDRIANDPLLRGAKLIAEAWDAAGAYQVGSFGTPAWSDWNGHYRDDMRKFWRGEPYMKSPFALRLTGSPDIYVPNGRGPANSVNMITCHDGFTLRDLVSFQHKHNHANGENNRDGHNHNFSSNQGYEGFLPHDEVNALRLRQQKDFITTLMLSLGVPMILGGDEFGRTQRGNNNAYCQDNEISWFDWGLLDDNRELFEFTKNMIAFRKENPVLQRDIYFDGKPVDSKGIPDIAWLDREAMHLDWNGPDFCLACCIHPKINEGAALCMMFNPTLEAQTFRVPKGTWQVRVDTSKGSGGDYIARKDAHAYTEADIVLGRRSLVVLTSTG